MTLITLVLFEILNKVPADSDTLSDCRGNVNYLSNVYITLKLLIKNLKVKA